MLKRIRVKFQALEIESAYYNDRCQQTKSYQLYLNYFFGLATFLLIFNDLVYVIWGDLDLDDFIYRACGFIGVCLVFCLLTNIAKMKACVRKVPYSTQEILLCLIAVTLVLILIAITLTSAANAKRPIDALYFGVNIMLESMWFVYFMSFFFANWRLKILLYFGLWILIYVFSARRDTLSAGDYLFYIRVFILQTIVFFLQEKSMRNDFERKYTAKQNSDSLKAILSQIHSNVIVRALNGEIKYINIKEISALMGTSPVLIPSPRGDESSRSEFANQASQIDFLFENIRNLELRKKQQMLQDYPNITQYLYQYDTLDKLLIAITLDPHLFDELKTEEYLALRGIFTIQPEMKNHFEINISKAVFDQKNCLVVVIRDVTDSVNHLQEINDMQINMLASISHELRTPLNHNINLLDQAIESKEVDSDFIDKYIQPALNQGKILSYFVNDVLDFQQIQKQGLRILPWHDASVQIIEECASLFSSAILNKRLKFNVDFDRSTFPIFFETDHTRVKQILLNLLSNALKFTMEGEITLRGHFNPEEQSLTFSVEDTGIGMSAEELRILKYKIDNSLFAQKVNNNSTGGSLGLTISNRIAQLLNTNGEGIKIKAEKDKGSEFSFTVSNLSNRRLEDFSLDRLKSIEDLNESVIKVRQSNPVESMNQGKTELISPGKLRKNARKVTIINGQINFHLKDGVGANEPYLSRDCNFIRSKTVYKCNSITTQPLLSDNAMFKSVDQMNVDDRLKPLSSQNLDELKCECPPILIVDDDAFNITSLEFILKSFHIVCDKAYHGREALEKLRIRHESPCYEHCQQYALILMDCNMPIMNGYDATKIIRAKIASGEWRDVPIVGCTAYEGKDKLDMCIEVGMAFYIQKPVNRKKLHDQILKKYLKSAFGVSLMPARGLSLK